MNILLKKIVEMDFAQGPSRIELFVPRYKFNYKITEKVD